MYWYILAPVGYGKSGEAIIVHIVLKIIFFGVIQLDQSTDGKWTERNIEVNTLYDYSFGWEMSGMCFEIITNKVKSQSQSSKFHLLLTVNCANVNADKLLYDTFCEMRCVELLHCIRAFGYSVCEQQAVKQRVRNIVSHCKQ